MSSSSSATSRKLLKDALVLVGPSGAGKSTLLKRLEQALPGRFGYSISHTTRDPRPGEVNGIHYHFITEAEFKNMIDRKEFLEYAVVHKTTYYGTSFKALEAVAKEGKVATMDLDIVGAQSMRDSYLRDCIVFIEVPSFDILEKRLRDRATESEDKITVRLESAQKEMEWFLQNRDFFDIQLLNDDIDVCFAKFRREVGRIIFGEKQSEESGVVSEFNVDAAASSSSSSKAASTEPVHSEKNDCETVPASQENSTSPERNRDDEHNNHGKDSASPSFSAEKLQQQQQEHTSESKTANN